jgi:hypothetical protein
VTTRDQAASDGQARRRAGGPGPLLGRRALNRALLARHLLLRRERLPVLEAVERLLGMQAQVPGNPYVALWSRLEGFRPEALSDLLAERRVVRAALMRSTIHLVTAEDCLALRPLVQPALDRDIHRHSTWGPAIGGMDLDALVAAGRELLEARPMSNKALGALLAERWPDRQPAALAYAVRCLAPLVQVPPRGLWGASAQATHTTVEAWLGRPLDPSPSIDGMVLRYLAAFGPATVADVQRWSGLTGLREVAERLRPGLRAFRDGRGRELLDVPDAPLPDADTPAPPRFLPEYDNVVLSHADRDRIAPEDAARLASRVMGIGDAIVLVDGFAAATWRLDRDGGAMTLRIRPFRPLADGDTEAVTAEAARLLDLVAADAATRGVDWAPPVGGTTADRLP